MAVFDAPAYDDHEAVIYVRDPGSGLRAIIAIHRSRGTTAGGGTRMMTYESEAAALNDALRLSRGMTYKHVMCDSPFGGGKAVIIGDPARDKTEALLLAMGRAIDDLGGRFLSGEDVGLSNDDVMTMGRVTKWTVGQGGMGADTSPMTAEGVFHAIRAAVAYRLGRDDLDGLRVAIQGVGGVGMALAERLAAAGAYLWVADVRPQAAAEAVTAFGATEVAVDAIAALDVDIFSPCALGGVLDDVTVPRIKAAIVAGAANNQLAADRQGVALHDGGVLYVPDYVANAGGVIQAVHGGSDGGEEEVARRLAAIGDRCREIFEHAAAEGVAASEAADRMARDRLAAG
jgi:leucine dehydrogenase